MDKSRPVDAVWSKARLPQPFGLRNDGEKVIGQEMGCDEDSPSGFAMTKRAYWGFVMTRRAYSGFAITKRGASGFAMTKRASPRFAMTGKSHRRAPTRGKSGARQVSPVHYAHILPVGAKNVIASEAWRSLCNVIFAMLPIFRFYAMRHALLFAVHSAFPVRPSHCFSLTVSKSVFLRPPTSP
jgi:hypothetical protein